MPEKELSIKQLLEEAAKTKRIYANALIESNRSFEEKVRELSTLRRAADAMLESADLHTILTKTLDIVFEEMEPGHCSIMLLDDKSERLVLRAARGEHDECAIAYSCDASPRVMAVGFGVAGTALKTRAPVLVVDAKDNATFKPLVGSVKIGSLLCAPLMFQQKPLGVLNMSNPEVDGLSYDSERLVSILTSLVSTAIENSSLLGKLINKERLSSLGKMAASMIHDMRTPMHVVAGFASLMAEDNISKEDREEYLAIINTQLKRFVSLAEETLEYTRGGEFDLKFTQTKLSSLAHEIKTSLSNSYKEKGISLKLSVERDLALEADEGKLLRALFNLTNNAAEAIKDKKGEISVAFTEGPQGAVITVADNGTGISSKLIETIFQPFVSSGKEAGTGLGLPIAKKIIESHGGAISVKSTVGVGTTFTVELPVASSSLNRTLFASIP